MAQKKAVVYKGVRELEMGDCPNAPHIHILEALAVRKDDVGVELMIVINPDLQEGLHDGDHFSHQTLVAARDSIANTFKILLEQ